MNSFTTILILSLGSCAATENLSYSESPSESETTVKKVFIEKQVDSADAETQASIDDSEEQEEPKNSSEAPKESVEYQAYANIQKEMEEQLKLNNVFMPKRSTYANGDVKSNALFVKIVEILEIEGNTKKTYRVHEVVPKKKLATEKLTFDSFENTQIIKERDLSKKDFLEYGSKKEKRIVWKLLSESSLASLDRQMTERIGVTVHGFFATWCGFVALFFIVNVCKGDGRKGWHLHLLDDFELGDWILWAVLWSCAGGLSVWAHCKTKWSWYARSTDDAYVFSVWFTVAFFSFCAMVIFGREIILIVKDSNEKGESANMDDCYHITIRLGFAFLVCAGSVIYGNYSSDSFNGLSIHGGVFVCVFSAWFLFINVAAEVNEDLETASTISWFSWYGTSWGPYVNRIGIAVFCVDYLVHLASIHKNWFQWWSWNELMSLWEGTPPAERGTAVPLNQLLLGSFSGIAVLIAFPLGFWRDEDIDWFTMRIGFVSTAAFILSLILWGIASSDKNCSWYSDRKYNFLK